jgi:hypothetical protein
MRVIRQRSSRAACSTHTRPLVINLIERQTRTATFMPFRSLRQFLRLHAQENTDTLRGNSTNYCISSDRMLRTCKRFSAVFL